MGALGSLASLFSFKSTKKILGAETGFVGSVRKLMNSGGESLLATLVLMGFIYWYR